MKGALASSRPPTHRRAANAAAWGRLLRAALPFADAATADLPLRRLLRLALFQVSVGMAAVLLTGTLNRVMIVELRAPAWLVAVMVALPLAIAPLRALIGFRSDHHRSFLGWRRGPYLWFGTLLQFGGLAIMPFALLILSGEAALAPPGAGLAAAAIAFLLTGAGLHTTQTAGLALATDLAPEAARPRVVALLYVALLAGMMVSALAFGALLQVFSPLKLVQIVQGAALATLALNLAAMWRQEPRDPLRTDPAAPRPRFLPALAGLLAARDARRLLAAVALGAMGFGMQDVLLEPYGAEALGLSVAATTGLTALWAAGALAGFALAAERLRRRLDPRRLAGFGAVGGAFAFALVLLAGVMHSAALLYAGAFALGLGGGLFAVGTLVAAMELATADGAGLALGAWGAAQATAAGLAIAAGGIARDAFALLARDDAFGAAAPTFGYAVIFQIEIAFLFAAMLAIGPLARHTGAWPAAGVRFGVPEFPT